MVWETCLSWVLRVSNSTLFGGQVILIHFLPWCPEHLHWHQFYWDVLWKGSGEAPSPCQGSSVCAGFTLQSSLLFCSSSFFAQVIPSTQTPLSSERETCAISQTWITKPPGFIGVWNPGHLFRFRQSQNQVQKDLEEPSSPTIPPALPSLPLNLVPKSHIYTT